ncbi:ABC transporter substrate-binding protein [Chromohalobacter canadensis]|uniref:ABC transporter substrate-binding protein n=2 Tax=Chromohalobacter canadensis TaxID=141389 RepID=A0ABZ0YBF6_9GAMM|nr:ABC transporter substrate-binding protein [Chromohalobacter canadensis]MCK0768685.1 ABC transporter substrate-binding protein [Chromohalobacter canadensis]WQH09188.1 ABC transporter substrate-binding protein [Chromohalobacter canadensis]
MLRLTRRLMGACLALVVIASGPAWAANDDDTSKMTSLKVMLDWYTNPSHAPLVIAQQRGFFEQHGLDVELVSPADPSVPPKLVAAGKIDMAISYQPQLHLQVDQGLPLVRVGTLIATPLNITLVRADSDIESMEDLAGKSIGYSVGGVEKVLIDTMLEHNGVSPEDVEMVNVNFALTPALIGEKVDAVTGAFRNFELAQMAQEGVKGRAFYIEEEGVPTYDELIFIANRDTLDANRDAYTRFMAAVEEATAWIINHPDEGWEAFKASDPALDTPVNKKAWYNTIPRFALRPATLDGRRYETFESFLLERGQIKAKSPLSRLAVDLSQP